jgi:hypothetical protein
MFCLFRLDCCVVGRFGGFCFEAGGILGFVYGGIPGAFHEGARRYEA